MTEGGAVEAQTELERLRWELELLVSKRVTAPFTAWEAARFEKLSRREWELLQALGRTGQRRGHRPDLRRDAGGADGAPAPTGLGRG